MQKFPYFFLMVALALSFGCGRPSSPSEWEAERFMDRYYVATDLKGALDLTDGLAREKVQGSLQLTEGQAMDASTHHPKIEYKLLDGTVNGPEASYLYLVTIRPSKMEPIQKKTLLRVRQREGGDWKVTQFSDHDSK